MCLSISENEVVRIMIASASTVKCACVHRIPSCMVENSFMNLVSVTVNVQDFKSSSSKAKSNSASSQKIFHIKMKPLETGRQIFSWFCTDAIDEPLNKYQTLARQICRFFLAVIFIAIIVAPNSLLFTNQIAVISIDELFFGLYQFITILNTASAFIATIMWGQKLASLFQSLESIYNACKGVY